jgi:hypothetical protein
MEIKILIISEDEVPGAGSPKMRCREQDLQR